MTADTGGREFFFDGFDEGVEFSSVVATGFSLVAGSVQIGELFYQPLLILIWRTGVAAGSCSRCQPSRHCCARNALARSAQDGQTEASVAPPGIITWPTSPVSKSVLRSCTGRMHAPCSRATILTTSRASGCDKRSAR